MGVAAVGGPQSGEILTGVAGSCRWLSREGSSFQDVGSSRRGMRAGPVGVDCGFPNGMFVPSTPLAATSSYLIPTSSLWHPEDDLVCKDEKSASHPWCAGWQVGNTARISQRDDADSSVLIPQLMVCRIILHSL